jgi:hypothetical protein
MGGFAVSEDFEDEDLRHRLQGEAHDRLRRYALACKRNQLTPTDALLRVVILAGSVLLTSWAAIAIWRLLAK